MQVDDDLHAEGGVVFGLDPEEVEEEGHEVRCVLAEGFDVRQAMQDLNEEVAEFLRGRSSSSALVRNPLQRHTLMLQLTCSPELDLNAGSPVLRMSVKQGSKTSNSFPRSRSFWYISIASRNSVARLVLTL